MSKVEKVLDDFRQRHLDDWDVSVNALIKDTSQQLLELMLECVGENEPIKDIKDTISQSHFEVTHLYPSIRNELRAKIRTH